MAQIYLSSSAASSSQAGLLLLCCSLSARATLTGPSAVGVVRALRVLGALLLQGCQLVDGSRVPNTALIVHDHLPWVLLLLVLDSQHRLL